MTKCKLVFAALALLMTSGAANAGSHECEATIKVGEEWTTIIGDTGSYVPNGCQFKTASKLGRRILKVCPDKSECVIYLPLRLIVEQPEGAPALPIHTINIIDGVGRTKP
jgi:hypothetical protein